MSHTYDIECFECGDKFCDCHPFVWIDEDEDRYIFCTVSCAEEFKIDNNCPDLEIKGL